MCSNCDVARELWLIRAECGAAPYHLTVNLYDDADAEAINQGWASYNTGRGVIIVLHAASQVQALDKLYSTHRSVLILEEGT